MYYQEPAEQEANLLQKIFQGYGTKFKNAGYQPAVANAKDLLDLTREIMGQTDEQKIINQQILAAENELRNRYR